MCQLTPEEMAAHRGDVNTPATSPYRDRPIEENLDLFARMKAGEFPDGAMTLRAKIDLASGNFNMRDPAIYRIKHMAHHRTGDKWCIYPMYDFAHPIEDALEGITHSLCTLEFESHRPLYDWVIDNISIPYYKPRQIEFARLGIDHTVMSKRKLRQLVEQNYVSGWDDPRMPTICGLRRRGYTPTAIRSFSEQIGVAKADSTVEYAFLEHCLRSDLDSCANRVMAVLRPVPLTITNYPEGQRNLPGGKPPQESRHGQSYRHLLPAPADRGRRLHGGARQKYKRLTPGGMECRLKGAYVITCTGCVKDENGNVIEVLAEYDPDSKGGNPSDYRKIKGAAIHWVDAATAVDAEIRLYDNLFSDAAPDAGGKDFLTALNPNSLTVLNGCKLEAALADAVPGASLPVHADRLLLCGQPGQQAGLSGV